MFVRILKAGISVTCVVGALASSAVGQNSGCWFPLTVEVVGEHPSLQKIGEKNVEVRVGGRPTKVNGIELGMASQLIVVMDTSGSMQSQGWKQVGTTIEDLLTGAPSDVKSVGLTTFNDSAVYASGREDSLKLLSETLQRGARGKTSILAALLASARHFNAGSSTVMIVVTDGEDLQLLNSFKAEKRELARQGVRTTFMITRNVKPSVEEEEFAPEELNGVADETGGLFIHLDRLPENAPHKFQPDAIRKMLEFYKIEIPPTSGRLKVDLVDDASKRAKDLKIHYRRQVNCIGSQ